jgi:hypothetical protein
MDRHLAQAHEVIETAVPPTAALAVGLKVDSEALPAAVVTGIQNGTVDLNERIELRTHRA